MSNLDVSKLNFKVIAPIAVAGAAVIYFGLSSYAGSQAEKNLAIICMKIVWILMCLGSRSLPVRLAGL